MSRLTSKMLEAYIQNATQLHVATGRMPDMPDRAVAMTKTSGGRDILNGTFEELTYRIQTRGKGGSIDDAERVALTVDELLDGSTMFDIEDVYILHIYHNASPRQINMTDPESRFNFTADYTVTASRNKGGNLD